MYLEGVVLDSLTQEPIPGAKVRIGTDQQETDASGAFLFSDLPAATYQVNVSHSCYVADSVQALLDSSISLAVLMSRHHPDHVWHVAAFTCEDDQQTSYRLERDGSPICGASECPGNPDAPPSGCWSGLLRPEDLGGLSVGDASASQLNDGGLRIQVSQYDYVYARTYIYSVESRIIEFRNNIKNQGIWLNDTNSTGTSDLALMAGWNTLEITTYSNGGDNSTIDPGLSTQGVYLTCSLNPCACQ